MSEEARSCFVISPIGADGSEVRRHADAVLEFIVKKAMAGFEREHEGVTIRTVRSDEIVESGSISDRMYDEIIGSDLCVAVLTRGNPNVFYELAVAQCAARPVIMLIEKGEKLPFDVQDLRCVEYELGDICELVGGKYADKVKGHIDAIHRQGWIAESLFEKRGYGQQQRFEQQLRRMMRKARPQPLDVGIDSVYRVPGSPGRITLLTGDVIRLHDLQKEIEAHGHSPVDVIVNLQLARYFEGSVPGALSGILRYMDAVKSPAGKIEKDSLYDSLRQTSEREGVTLPAPLGSVIATPTTRLREEGLGIRYVFHVAAMTGSVGDGYKMMDDLLDDCVRNVYRRFKELAREREAETLLFPLLGSSATQLEPEEVALRLLRPIVNRMKRTDECRETYVLAWLESHRFAVRRAAKELGLSEVIEEGPTVNRAAASIGARRRLVAVPAAVLRSDAFAASPVGEIAEDRRKSA